MKYIIIDKDGIELPIVFEGNILTHNEVVPFWFKENVVSAGFCHHDGGDWYCSGESVSLNKKSRREDSAILNRFLK